MAVYGVIKAEHHVSIRALSKDSKVRFLSSTADSFGFLQAPERGISPKWLIQPGERGGWACIKAEADFA